MTTCAAGGSVGGSIGVLHFPLYRKAIRNSYPGFSCSSYYRYRVWLLLRIPPNIHSAFLLGKEVSTGLDPNWSDSDTFYITFPSDSTNLHFFFGFFQMGRGLIGREYFRYQLRYHKKRFARVRTNNLAYKRIIKKCQFFENHAQSFGVAVLFNKEDRTFESHRIKEEEDREIIFVPVPPGYLPKLPPQHAKQA